MSTPDALMVLGESVRNAGMQTLAMTHNLDTIMPVLKAAASLESQARVAAALLGFKPKARRLVFVHAKLLGRILANLPRADLYKVQSVNRYFKQVIQENKELRQIMLVDPNPGLSLRALSKAICDPKLSKKIEKKKIGSMWPFSISQVFVVPDKKVLRITIKLDKDWADKNWSSNFEELTKRQIFGSWSKMIIPHKGLNVMFTFEMEGSADREAVSGPVLKMREDLIIDLRVVVNIGRNVAKEIKVDKKSAMKGMDEVRVWYAKQPD